MDIASVPPQDTTPVQAPTPILPEHLGLPSEEGPVPRLPARRRGPLLALLAGGLVVLWLVSISVYSLMQIGNLRGELRRTLSDLANEERNLGAVTRKLNEFEGELPPNVPAIVEQVKESIFTVHAGPYLGTGFVVRINSPKGYQSGIVTNAHVVDVAIRDPSTPVFVSQGSKRLKARLWSWDARNDLALLFIKDFFTPLPWWDDRRHTPQVGDFVLAIGSPYGLEASTTTGVVSKITKDFIQTDAAVNPGNSGGPLVNRYGEVVGVVSYTLSQSQNVNFAVPIEAACHGIMEC